MDTDSQAGGKRQPKRKPRNACSADAAELLFIEIEFAHFLQRIAPKNSHASFWDVQIMVEMKMSQT